MALLVNDFLRKNVQFKLRESFNYERILLNISADEQISDLYMQVRKYRAKRLKIVST